MEQIKETIMKSLMVLLASFDQNPIFKLFFYPVLGYINMSLELTYEN